MGTGENPVSDSFRAEATSRHTGSGLVVGLVHGAATLSMGMVAGIFLDWAINIMPALSKVDDRTFVAVMQQTITTMNGGPIFLFTLTGAFVFTGVAALLQYRLGARAAAGWILAALGLYVVAMLITAVVHFPLNDTLEHAGDPDTIASLSSLRADTEGAWVTGHVLRTVAALLAFAFLCRALWLRRSSTVQK
jgi:uncharacterized membrane protein